MTVGNTLGIRAKALSANGRATGFDYFVDPAFGRDTNDGLSTASPLKTVAAAETAIGTAGGKTVGLMRGSYLPLDFSTAYTAVTTIRSVIRFAAVIPFIRGATPENMLFTGIKVLFPDSGVAIAPDSVADVVGIDDGTNITFDDVEVGGEKTLRTGRCFRLAHPTNVTIKNSRFHNSGRGGIRMDGVIANVTIQNNKIGDLVTTPIGTGIGSSTDGLDILGNEIFDFRDLPDDPDWTSGETGTWAVAHYRGISKNCPDLGPGT